MSAAAVYALLSKAWREQNVMCKCTPIDLRAEGGKLSCVVCGFVVCRRPERSAP